jgi:predicted ATPase
VNLIVGDQGSGKTTLLQQTHLWVTWATSKHKESFDERTGLHTRDLAVVGSWVGSPGKVGYFDFEKNNPRTAPALGMYGVDIGTQVSSMFSSHGQFVRGFLGSLSALGTGTLLLDEPDMALSPRSIHTLVKAFEQGASGGGQILATAHNPLLIASFPEVLSLEHQRWMPSHEFLASQATDPVPNMDGNPGQVVVMK